MCANELLAAWEGSSEPSGGRVVAASTRWSRDPNAPATDYDLACEVEGVLGLVPVGGGYGLVLGDEVPMSTWLPVRHSSAVDLVVPLAWGDFGDELFSEALATVPETAFEPTELVLDVPSGRATLFPACDSPDGWVYGGVDVLLEPGRYGVSTVDFDCGWALLRIHRLTKLERAR